MNGFDGDLFAIREMDAFEGAMPRCEIFDRLVCQIHDANEAYSA